MKVSVDCLKPAFIVSEDIEQLENSARFYLGISYGRKAASKRNKARETQEVITARVRAGEFAFLTAFKRV